MGKISLIFLRPPSFNLHFNPRLPHFTLTVIPMAYQHEFSIIECLQRRILQLLYSVVFIAQLGTQAAVANRNFHLKSCFSFSTLASAAPRGTSAALEVSLAPKKCQKGTGHNLRFDSSPWLNTRKRSSFPYWRQCPDGVEPS
jgi:hypothetical protein